MAAESDETCTPDFPSQFPVSIHASRDDAFAAPWLQAPGFFIAPSNVLGTFVLNGGGGDWNQNPCWPWSCITASSSSRHVP
jgi:hypothetical protein